MLKKRRGGKEKKRKKKKRESVAARVFVQRSIEKSKEERRRNGIDRYIFIIYIYIYTSGSLISTNLETGRRKRSVSRVPRESTPVYLVPAEAEQREKEREREIKTESMLDLESWSMRREPCDRSKDPLCSLWNKYIYIYIYINEHAPTKSPPLGEWNC